MNFSDGYIYVDYHHAEGAAEDLGGQSQTIMSALANLEMELSDLRNSWIGDDKDVYSDVQAKWDSEVEKIKELLATHSTLLTDISANYRRTERNLSQRWGEIKAGSR
ncbi:WXG100 family type VII secretion target [Streptomyces tsukubensis]|nr:WXG100 family type VII secretion target [Streptomyces tsukubensis]